MTNAPVPMARKVSVPADTTDELSREEYELSKRETVNVEDAARKISAVEINDSDSETEEDANQARKYSSSLAEEVPAKNIEEEKHVSRSSSSSLIEVYVRRRWGHWKCEPRCYDRSMF